MPNIGFKIVDKDEDIVIDILKEAEALNAPVELGLYGESQRVRELCSKLSMPVNIHFNHILYSMMQIREYEEAFFDEIRVAKEIRADYGIAHMAKYPMTGQKGYKKRVIKEVVSRMLVVEEYAQRAKFDIYIENTFESVSFYRQVFAKLKDTKRLHFCFDIGHAKVWSGDDFRSWIEFLDELKEWGFRLHFHLHTNRGLIDEHLSLIEAKELDFDGVDGVFSDITYEDMFVEIFDKFPNDRMIFEVKPYLAIENREHILNILQNNSI